VHGRSSAARLFRTFTVDHNVLENIETSRW
jgi:hypothetical protein